MRISRLTVSPVPQCPRTPLLEILGRIVSRPSAAPNSFSRDLHVLGNEPTTHCPSLGEQSCCRSRPYSPQWIQHPVARVGERQHWPLYQFPGELTGVTGCLHVVMLDVWNVPNVSRVLAEGAAGRLARRRSFTVFLLRALPGNPDWIQVKGVRVTFGVRENRLVTTREPPRTAQPRSNVPDDPVAKGEPKGRQDGMENDIKRNYRVLDHHVSRLPTQVALRVARFDTMCYHLLLLGTIGLKGPPPRKDFPMVYGCDVPVSVELSAGTPRNQSRRLPSNTVTWADGSYRAPNVNGATWARPPEDRPARGRSRGRRRSGSPGGDEVAPPMFPRE
jgi:hypothetical protein